MAGLDDFAARKLSALDSARLRRTLKVTDRQEALWVERDGRRLLSFSCNDYLNLTHHPNLKSAAQAAIERYGVGAGASRLITGNHPLYEELEARLARLKGTAAACLFGSGYLANAGILPVLAGKGDLLLLDALSHSCLWAGAQLSLATVLTFRHNDVADLENVLAANRAAHRHALIVTDSVFSMDGDVAPLEELGALARRFEAWLMTDDAHGLGVLAGKHRVDLQMGTLSKALGSYGGYLCASEPVIDLIKTRARTLIYSTALPPASVAAAIAALEIIESDPDLTARPLQKARRFTRMADLPLAQSPIVPVILGDAQRALDASARLESEGFLVVAIRPPTVPEGSARLRIAFSAGHNDSDIDRLAEVVRKEVLRR